jgi:hypothetical protein
VLHARVIVLGVDVGNSGTVAFIEGGHWAVNACPNNAEVLDFVRLGRRWTATIGRFPDGRLAERLPRRR